MFQVFSAFQDYVGMIVYDKWKYIFFRIYALADASKIFTCRKARCARIHSSHRKLGKPGKKLIFWKGQGKPRKLRKIEQES